MASSKSKSGPTSAQLKGVLQRMRSDQLTAQDKRILADTLKRTIELKSVLERATKTAGRKKVVASLPFGFDIVK